jgi:hypothetical protein
MAKLNLTDYFSSEESEFYFELFNEIKNALSVMSDSNNLITFISLLSENKNYKIKISKNLLICVLAISNKDVYVFRSVNDEWLLTDALKSLCPENSKRNYSDFGTDVAISQKGELIFVSDTQYDEKNSGCIEIFQIYSNKPTKHLQTLIPNSYEGPVNKFGASITVSENADYVLGGGTVNGLFTIFTFTICSLENQSWSLYSEQLLSSNSKTNIAEFDKIYLANNATELFITVIGTVVSSGNKIESNNFGLFSVPFNSFLQNELKLFIDCGFTDIVVGKNQKITTFIEKNRKENIILVGCLMFKDNNQNTVHISTYSKAYEENYNLTNSMVLKRILN